MAKVKFLGELTMLNGMVIRQGETREVSEKQANSLIADHPDQWALVGGTAQVEEPAAPQPTLVYTENFNAGGEDLKKVITAKPAKTGRKTARKPRKRG